MPQPSPTLSRIAALVPVRALEGAKARLGEALDAEERRALVERLLARTVAAAVAEPEISLVGVVSPDREVLAYAAALGATPVAQAGGGLNEGLAEAAAWALSGGADAVVVVPADLPAVGAEELGAVVAAARAAAGDAERTAAGDAAGAGTPPARRVVVLVPDRGGSGTNVLLVAPPFAIPFAFGEGSRSAHAGAARAAGCTYLELDSPLALDLDTPDDLLVAEAAGLPALRGPEA